MKQLILTFFLGLFSLSLFSQSADDIIHVKLGGIGFKNGGCLTPNHDNGILSTYLWFLFPSINYNNPNEFSISVYDRSFNSISINYDYGLIFEEITIEYEEIATSHRCDHISYFEGEINLDMSILLEDAEGCSDEHREVPNEIDLIFCLNSEGISAAEDRINECFGHENLSNFPTQYCTEVTIEICCEYFFSKQNGTSLRSNKNLDFSVTPNPVNEGLSIKILNGDNSINMFEVVSLDGETGFSGEFYETIDLDLSNFLQGIYIVRVITANGSIRTEKVVKK